MDWQYIYTLILELKTNLTSIEQKREYIAILPLETLFRTNILFMEHSHLYRLELQENPLHHPFPNLPKNL
jgi:hypothetical protein